MSDSNKIETGLPMDVRDLQPSARHVYRELVFAGEPITITDLQHRSGLGLRTIRRAVDDLEECGRIRSRWDTDDARRRVVDIPDKSAGNS